MTDGSRLLAGRYEIGDLIGRGGMADVHLGTDTRLGRRVAIKLLKPSLAVDPKFRQMFREEAQKAARMAHPTIVRVFDAGEETVPDQDGVGRPVPFIVMEYVDGRLLKDIISDGPVAPHEAVRIIAQVLTALEYSHRALLVHRDIKPGNIMVTQSGQVKVMDFGIARAVSDNSATVAETGAVLGTAQYFSPEQARGETVDARTDLYSTGVILFELLTGRAPFRGERPAAVAYQHISEAAVAPSTINPKVSPALDAVVLHSLNKDKFDRYQTAAEFRGEVETAGAGEVPAQRRPSVSDFNSTLFGINPHLTAGSEATLRQLTINDDQRIVRTQARPPVAWIWAGVLLIAAVLFAVVFWVVGLPREPAQLGENLSVTVPDLAGSTGTAGSDTLEQLGLVPNVRGEASATVPEGVVIRTMPNPGEKVPPKDVVNLFVSLGKNPTTVPRLDGLAEAAAKEAIVARKLVYGKTIISNDPGVPAGTVISADPASGSDVKEGDEIDLVVSNGQVDLPSVVGQPYTTAITTLQQLQFAVDVRPDSSCSGGLVTDQSLPPGPQAQRSEIRLTYCAN